MGVVQLWQAEDLGTDKETLKKVLRTYREDGIQGIESQQALAKYVKKLSDDSLRDMYEIDREAASLLFVDCFGASMAFEKAIQMLGYATVETVQRMGWISPAAYEEVVEKYDERIKKLNEDKDRILSDYTRAANIAEDAETEIIRLRDELAHCKADLYDFYAQQGKLPNYERR